jgi:hypothetical protein
MIGDGAAALARPFLAGEALYSTNKAFIDGTIKALDSAAKVGTAIEDWIGDLFF